MIENCCFGLSTCRRRWQFFQIPGQTGEINHSPQIIIISIIPRGGFKRGHIGSRVQRGLEIFHIFFFFV